MRFSSEILFSSGGFSSLECGAAPGAFPGGGRNCWEISQPGPGSPEALPKSHREHPKNGWEEQILSQIPQFRKIKSSPGFLILEKNEIISQVSGKSNPLPCFPHPRKIKSSPGFLSLGKSNPVPVFPSREYQPPAPGRLRGHLGSLPASFPTSSHPVDSPPAPFPCQAGIWMGPSRCPGPLPGVPVPSSPIQRSSRARSSHRDRAPRPSPVTRCPLDTWKIPNFLPAPLP